MSVIVSQSLLKGPEQSSGELDPQRLKLSTDRNVAVLDVGPDLRVVIYRGAKYSWDSFVKNAPPSSIGADGFVAAHSRSSRHHWNFDHHGEGVDRLNQQSTCLQVFDGLQNGLGSGLVAAGGQPTIFLNHICPDGIFTVHAVSNREKYMADNHSNKPIGLLFALEDLVDRGSNKIDLKDPTLEILNWIVEPWWRDRARLEQDPISELSSTVEAVLFRLSEFERGSGGRRPIQVKYRLLNQSDKRAPQPFGYMFFSEESPFTRPFLAQQGQRGGFISLLSQDGDKYWYRLGLFDYLAQDNFPALTDLCSVLNRAEQLLGNLVTAEPFQQNGGSGKYNRWGSSQIVGGCPPGGSLLSPAELVDVVNNYIVCLSSDRGSNSSLFRHDLFLSEILPDLITSLVAHKGCGAFI